MQQYHQFQCSRLRESSRLVFEHQTLLEEPQCGGNMEIYAGKKDNWTGEFAARFLLKLPVDFSNIPTCLLKDVNEGPGEDVALLSVGFEDTEATRVYPKRYLSPRVEHSLGGSSALHMPAFPGGGISLIMFPKCTTCSPTSCSMRFKAITEEESILLPSSATWARVSWNMMQKALQNSPCC